VNTIRNCLFLCKQNGLRLLTQAVLFDRWRLARWKLNRLGIGWQENSQFNSKGPALDSQAWGQIAWKETLLSPMCGTFRLH
jgi:hypothetical protein